MTIVQPMLAGINTWMPWLMISISDAAQYKSFEASSDYKEATIRADQVNQTIRTLTGAMQDMVAPLYCRGKSVEKEKQERKVRDGARLKLTNRYVDDLLQDQMDRLGKSARQLCTAAEAKRAEKTTPRKGGAQK
jgi:hypothetical protein